MVSAEAVEWDWEEVYLRLWGKVVSWARQCYLGECPQYKQWSCISRCHEQQNVSILRDGIDFGEQRFYQWPKWFKFRQFHFISRWIVSG